MKKLIAITNVIAWSGFWAFGYIALTAEGLTAKQVNVAFILAALGFLSGIIAYTKLSRGHRINNKAMGFTHPHHEG
ncbi:MAG: hypothetical protein ACRBBT_13875 [Paracoccaceae bacterium]